MQKRNYIFIFTNLELKCIVSINYESSQQILVVSTTPEPVTNRIQVCSATRGLSQGLDLTCGVTEAQRGQLSGSVLEYVTYLFSRQASTRSLIVSHVLVTVF